jgi:cell division protein FtsW
MSLDRFRSNKANPDFTYISLAAILVLFGLVMISSSSVVVSSERFNQNYAYVFKQLTALVIGLFGAVILSIVDYRTWRQYAKPFFWISVILLLIVFIPGIGKSAKGAARWINLGSFQLQPSELVKISFILYFAAWLEQNGKLIKTFKKGLLPFAGLVIPLIFILIQQRDMGTLLVILGTAGAMFFVGGATMTQIGLSVASGIGMIGFLIMIEPYRLQRLMTYLQPNSDKLGSGYHISQSLLAIGSGGLWGRGFGKSLQKYLYLPEPHTDSIFAIIVEELGFFRALLVLAVIGLFAYRGYQIAARAGDDFGRMVAFGITTALLLQAIINIGAILGILPLTGVPLPLISYGGTSLIVMLSAIGLVVNISKHGYGK